MGLFSESTNAHDAAIEVARQATVATVEVAKAKGKELAAIAAETARQTVEVAKVNAGQAVEIAKLKYGEMEKAAQNSMKVALRKLQVKEAKINLFVWIATYICRVLVIPIVLRFAYRMYEIRSRYTEQRLANRTTLRQLDIGDAHDQRQHEYRMEELANRKYEMELKNPRLPMLKMLLDAGSMNGENMVQALRCLPQEAFMQLPAAADSLSASSSWEYIDGTGVPLRFANDSLLPEDSASQTGTRRSEGLAEPSILSQSHFSLVSPVGDDANRCFLADALFKSPSGSFIQARLLEHGSRVCAADGQPVSVMSKRPFSQDAMVELQTASACLLVTASHRVVVPREHGRRSTIFARDLRVGDAVLCSGDESFTLTRVYHFTSPMDVVEIVLNPDSPVETFHVPMSSILSMGQSLQSAPGTSFEQRQHQRTRRGGMNRRSAAQAGQQQESIPATHDPFD